MPLVAVAAAAVMVAAVLPAVLTTAVPHDAAIADAAAYVLEVMLLQVVAAGILGLLYDLLQTGLHPVRHSSLGQCRHLPLLRSGVLLLQCGRLVELLLAGYQALPQLLHYIRVSVACHVHACGDRCGTDRVARHANT